MLSLRLTKSISSIKNSFSILRYLSNKSAVITKVHRKFFLKQYQTLIVQPDGSTYTTRYFQPRRIIKLPLDLSTLSAEEKKRILDMRKPKKKVVIEEEIKDKFDFKNYVKYVNKK